MDNPNYKFGKSLLTDGDLKKAAPFTGKLHKFYMQCGKSDDDSHIMVALRPETGAWPLRWLLTVYNRIKLQVDLQADKSPVVVKGPFLPRVVNPRYRIRGTMRDARVDILKQET
jgi:hypothetical protein